MSNRQTRPMPEELERLYQALWQEVVWVHIVWNQYRGLFAKPEHVELLNWAAPGFFRVCHDALLEDVMLTLCRLTDPAQSCGRPNFVVARVAAAVEAYGDAGLTARLDARRVELNDRCEVFRQHRNKRIAHADLNYAMCSTTLDGFSREDIGNALASLRGFINVIALHFEGAETEFRVPGTLSGEADALRHVLREAKAYRAHRIAGRVDPYADGVEGPRHLRLGDDAFDL